MRRIKLTFVSFLILVGLVYGISAAIAAPTPQASGTGKTHLGATLGFVAKADLTGNFTYKLGDFRAKCQGYTWFVQPKPNQVKFTATCTDQNGDTVYLAAAMVDKGEPGTNDQHCIGWSYTEPPRNALNHSFPWFIMDHGKISNGNIQIK